jgi:hypothetical protein
MSLAAATSVATAALAPVELVLAALARVALVARQPLAMQPPAPAVTVAQAAMVAMPFQARPLAATAAMPTPTPR